MKKFYLQVRADGIITDAIDYPYGDYIEYETDVLPVGLIGGWFKFDNGTIIECPELKPKSDTDIQEQLAELAVETDYRLSLVELGLV